MTTDPQILSCTILPAAGGARRQDGCTGTQGDLLVALRLGQQRTFLTVTPRGDLLITGPDASRYSIVDGCLHYADCCQSSGGGTPTPTARDFRPEDFQVGQDFS